MERGTWLDTGTLEHSVLISHPELRKSNVLYSPPMFPYSIYIHIPFCRHRCAYCDFNTYAGLDGLILEYTRALCQEILYSAAS